MKKIFSLFILLGAITFTQAQSYNIVSGTLTNCYGPVSGHPVFIYTDSVAGVMYANFAVTNASGYYTDTIPYNTFFGGVQPIHIYTNDPSPLTGTYTWNENPTTSGNTYINDTLMACPPLCWATYYYYEDSTGVDDTTYITLNYGTSDPAATTITWDYGDGFTSTGTNTTHVYAANGTYYVCVTLFNATDSCSATYCDSVGDYYRSGFILATQTSGAAITSVKENSTQLEGVKIYPNPAQNELFITSPNLAEATSIVIYDMTGRAISITNNNATTNNTRLNISNLESGSYVLVLFDKTNAPLYSHKLIKQ